MATKAELRVASVDPSLWPLRPLVDFAAGIRASVHAKLLSGFLAVSVLLVAMAIVSLYVIGQMSARAQEMNALDRKVSDAHQMKYDITAQMHYRAMTLLTGDDAAFQKINVSKAQFDGLFGDVKTIGREPSPGFYDKVKIDNDAFNTDSAVVDGEYQLWRAAVAAKDPNAPALLAKALADHLNLEHPASHVVEADMDNLQASVNKEAQAALADFNRNRATLVWVVASFSVVSLLAALLLGFVLSWSFIRPVRTIDRALAGIAAGRFGLTADVLNRDELGTLTTNLNETSTQLANLYSELKDLNANLQQKVADQLAQINRATELKRYLPPQLADSILAGTVNLAMASRRKNLTVFFSDIRGFTSLSERVEPEELIDYLNQYLSAMTEIVFRWGGTLDKYIGDAIMVFFGDPVEYEDHPQRAVKMALEMRAALQELQHRWFMGEEPLSVGMGIVTGYVTVGNVGSSVRTQYTVVGNHVNLASRLADKAAGAQILVSERTMASCTDFAEGDVIEEIELEGVSRPIKIFSIRERE
ncbi:MAG TPA: adenylate/guanylate cyclase domain-containing protein, partial [Chloroflexota bacterium]